MAGLIDGISQKRFKDEGPIDTGGAPALVGLSSPRLATRERRARKYTTGY